MRCPVCGRENNNGNKFCDSCGARLVGGNSPKPSKNRAVLLAIVSVLVIILLGECAYLLVLKLKQKPSSTAAATTAVSAEAGKEEAAPSASATNKPVTTQEKQEAKADPGQKSEPGKSEDPGQKATQEPVVKTQEEKEPKTDPNTEPVSEPKPSEPEHEPPKDEPDMNKYYYYNGHTYAFYDAKEYNLETYDEVSSFCRKQGGHLAVINDEKENNFLYVLAVKNYEDTTVFFGYTDKDREGTWEWDGQKSDYTNWTQSADWDLPDNGAGWGGSEKDGGEDYAEFNYDKNPEYGQPNDGTWNDAKFMENTTIFICEWEYDMKDVLP